MKKGTYTITLLAGQFPVSLMDANVQLIKYLIIKSFMIYYQQNFICLASVQISISSSGNFLDTHRTTYKHTHMKKGRTPMNKIFYTKIGQ